MPVLPVNDDPTWAEIEAGLEVAAKTSRDAERAARASLREMNTAKAAADVHRDEQRQAEANFDQWLNAARRKAYTSAT